ncbi:Alpha-mannosidase [Stanieria cyanosphaera PCC 7437]|uniref:Alpha-mannosidase n=1 Tax=Stanieria cyanosphaera (strain ATCC 29371 / PCC 7437) TaxID=111780 RepID=K9Y074_STAC7|nr:alpha-mannosidase [Stanieria cyanosphaera]AFZ37786.1 Alpha-mannosidase [Stanieria cyanosphaera PCC 7437]
MSDFLIAQITQIVQRLSALTKIDLQNNWHYTNFDFAFESENLIALNLNEWQNIVLNERRYIVWEKGRKIYWLAQKIIVPEHLQNYPVTGLNLRLVLTWWAEDAQIFVNGKLVQQGDLFDSSTRILLTNNAQPGEEFVIAIRLISPGHDIGALMRSHCVYESNYNQIDPGFVATELSILSKYLNQFEPEKLIVLASEIEKIKWNLVLDAEEFNRHLNHLRQRLLPLAKNIKQRCFYPLGHAHLDMAWLWTTNETYQVAERTFQSVLNLQQQFPNLTFGHTTSALYKWIEQNRPELFSELKKAIKLGKWEILGGMWVEPDVNLISGESIIRQLFYGQKYLAEKFEQIATIAWLPDSFGFSWQLPQILKGAGIDYFVTGKLHWNDTTKFPYGCFWWESPDGTKLLTLMSPPNVTGVMDTNPITMTNYAVEWESQTGLQDIFWLPGVGDHGGGPTKDMLEVAAKWNNSPFFPRIQFTTASQYLAKINQTKLSLPTWQDELYLELHRGCYTTHSDQKKFNRYCEGLLYQAELFATLASTINENRFDCGTLSHYLDSNPNFVNSQPWQSLIEIAWKKVLFNQFHDILPGTSIPEVFAEANRDWQAAIEIGETILKQALSAIASQIKLPAPPQPNAKPIVVFNSLNWQRDEVVSIAATKSNWEVYDLQGNKLPSQLSCDNQLLFLAEAIPSVGYRLFWLVASEVTHANSFPNHFILENQYLKVKVNPTTGDLDSLFDKTNQKEILQGAGNQLQAYRDRGQYWDAWDIDPNYQQYPLPPAELIAIEWLDYGTIQQRLRVIRKLGSSEFTQDYLLQTNSPSLKITNVVNWQETQVVVKAAFPFNLTSDYATYEIACGAIARATEPQTKVEQAKWEVPALKWADLTDSNQNYGVSLLNDCKYGYDSQSDQLRLTLLRSSLWPDPTADKGIHQFTYAIYPHIGSWELARTVHKSYELNIPLQVININIISSKEQQLSPVGSFLDLSAENLILMALKPDRETKNLILRCYECHGKTTELYLQGDLDLNIKYPVDFLEQSISNSSALTHPKSYQVQPWQIISLKMS